MSLRIQSFVVGPLPNNAYLVSDQDSGESVVIDPSIGSEVPLAAAQKLQEQGIRLKAIWNTHGHFDHVYDNARWAAEFAVPIAMHSGDLFLLDRLRDQAAFFGMQPPEVAPPEHDLQGVTTVSVGGYQAQVLHVPGHSPGSVAFYFADAGVCISGDVLFKGSVGRTDLPDCSSEQLSNSLRILTGLPGSTRILSGHGDETTVASELATNPFCRPLLNISDDEVLP